MDDKNIETYNVFGSNQGNNNAESQNLDNSISNQNSVNVNQVWPNAQFENTSSPVNNFGYQNIEKPQVIDNTYEEQPVMPNIQTTNMNTLNQEVFNNFTHENMENGIENNIASSEISESISIKNVKDTSDDIKSNKGNGYKEKSSNALIIIIFILLALVIIFLPQISNLLK